MVVALVQWSTSANINKELRRFSKDFGHCMYDKIDFFNSIFYTAK